MISRSETSTALSGGGREVGEGGEERAALGLRRLEQPFVGAEAEGGAGALGAAGADPGGQRRPKAEPAGGVGGAERDPGGRAAAR